MLVLSYLDLMQLAVSLQRLQDNLVAEGQLLGISGWAYLMLGVSTILQVGGWVCWLGPPANHAAAARGTSGDVPQHMGA